MHQLSYSGTMLLSGVKLVVYNKVSEGLHFVPFGNFIFERFSASTAGKSLPAR
jgi:hypothetical protein